MQIKEKATSRKIPKVLLWMLERSNNLPHPWKPTYSPWILNWPLRDGHFASTRNWASLWGSHQFRFLSHRIWEVWGVRFVSNLNWTCPLVMIYFYLTYFVIWRDSLSLGPLLRWASIMSHSIIPGSCTQLLVGRHLFLHARFCNALRVRDKWSSSPILEPALFPNYKSQNSIRGIWQYLWKE